MLDQKVKIYTRGMIIELYKRGVDQLENTIDDHGINDLIKLMYIFENSNLKSASLSEISNFSEEAKRIVDNYINVYFPA